MVVRGSTSKWQQLHFTRGQPHQEHHSCHAARVPLPAGGRPVVIPGTLPPHRCSRKDTMQVNPVGRNKQSAGVSLFARLFYCRGSDLSLFKSRL